MPRIDIHETYMRIASTYAEMSYARRKKVGALLVKEGRIISTGYNGMPMGMNNRCERTVDGVNVTKREVIHAEMNALMFAARNGQSTKDCILYVTLSPCFECSKLIAQAGVSKVYYSEQYRDCDGLDFLKHLNIEVEHLPLDNDSFRFVNSLDMLDIS